MLKAENIKTIMKIGEGAFGEVFKYSKNGSNHILKVNCFQKGAFGSVLHHMIA